MERRNPDREGWSLMAPLLDAALDLPPEARAAFIDRACGGNPERRARLAALVAAAEREDGPIERFPASAAAAIAADLEAEPIPPGEDSGRRFGPSRLVEEIARDDRTSPHIAESQATDGTGLPIAARFSYRLRCFVRRHRAGLLVAAGIAVLALAVAVPMTILRVHEESRRERELQRWDRAAEFVESLIPPSAAESDPELRGILDRAAREVDRKLGDDPLMAATVHDVIGESYLVVGDALAARSHFQAEAVIMERFHPVVDLHAALDDLAAALDRRGRNQEAERVRHLSRTHGVRPPERAGGSEPVR